MSYYTAWNNNLGGDKSWDAYQQCVSNCPELWNRKATVDPNDHKDRFYSDGKGGGEIFSWDQNANGGKGAWGVSGETHKNPYDPKFSASDITWYTSEQYADESDGKHMNYV